MCKISKIFRRWPTAPKRRRARLLEVALAASKTLMDYIFYPAACDSPELIALKQTFQKSFLTNLNAMLQTTGEIATFDKEHGLVIER